MPYDDVPERLLAGDLVPQSEIIAWNAVYGQTLTMLSLNSLEWTGAMAKEIVAEHMNWRITAYGMHMRDVFITRLEGECDE